MEYNLKAANLIAGEIYVTDEASDKLHYYFIVDDHGDFKSANYCNENGFRLSSGNLDARSNKYFKDAYRLPTLLEREWFNILLNGGNITLFAYSKKHENDISEPLLFN